MSIPTNLADINAFTQQKLLPRMIDTVFNDAVLFNILVNRNRVSFTGGTYIQSPLMYGELNGSMFTRTTGTSFDISYVQTDAAVIVYPKYGQVSVRLYGVDDVVNSGREAAFSQVESKMYNASQKWAKMLGTQIYKDGQTSSQDVTSSGGLLSTSSSLDGLLAWIDDGNTLGSTTYTAATDLTKSFAAVGGVNRVDLLNSAASYTTAVTPDANLFGLNSYVDRTFTFTLPKVTEAIGKVWHGNKKPDVIVGANAVWNKFSNSIQPMQRLTSSDTNLGKSGFRALEYQQAEVIVDKYCPSGIMFGLNMSTLEFYFSDKKKFQFGFTGFKEAQDGIDLAGQILFAGNLLCNSPRHNFKLVGTSLS